MKAMLSLVAGVIAYVCVGTVLAQALAVSWMASRGFFEGERIRQALAVLQGVDLAQIAPREAPLPEEQPSLDDLARAQALKTRQIELREAALKQGLEKWRFELARITEERQEVARLKTEFEKQLLALKAEAVEGDGQQTVRATLERSKPKDAKKQLQEMLRRDELEVVVALLAQMPTATRAKIAAEFKTPEETVQLATILRKMREQRPEVPLIEETAAALQNEPAATDDKP